MQQLWLNHKRIDSIGQLRTLFAEAKGSEELMDALCSRLLEYARSGVLASWLTRQSESTGESFDPGAEKLTAAIRVLQSSVRDDMQLQEALAELTGISVECFAEAQKLCSCTENEIEEKLSKLQKQPWWNAHTKTFALVKPQDWNLVVQNQSQLQEALEILRADSKVQKTVYLCNTSEMQGKWYVLDLRKVENVTIVGIENPQVQYYRFGEAQEIDVRQKGIFLQDFRLRFHGQICLKNYEGFSSHFSVTRD